MKRMASPRPVDVSLIQNQCRKPASVNSRVRRAPPGVVSASSTSTCNPAWARTIAAASPFGPEPITHALRFIAKPSGNHQYFYDRVLDQDLLPRLYRRPFDDFNLAIRLSLQGRRIQPQQLSPPPHSGCVFFSYGCEPVLPKHGTNLTWRLLSERISCEQREDILAVRKQP